MNECAWDGRHRIGTGRSLANKTHEIGILYPKPKMKWEGRLQISKCGRSFHRSPFVVQNENDAMHKQRSTAQFPSHFVSILFDVFWQCQSQTNGNWSQSMWKLAIWSIEAKRNTTVSSAFHFICDWIEVNLSTKSHIEHSIIISQYTHAMAMTWSLHKEINKTNK